jgi:hypothetical protein
VHATKTTAFAFSPNGRYLAASTKDGVKRYDLRCVDHGDPSVTNVRKTNSPVVSALSVDDNGGVIGGDVSGNVAHIGGDDSSTDHAPC